MALGTVGTEPSEPVIDRDRRIVVSSMAGVAVLWRISEFEACMAGLARYILVLPCQPETGVRMIEFHRRGEFFPAFCRMTGRAFECDRPVRGSLRERRIVDPTDQENQTGPP